MADLIERQAAIDAIRKDMYADKDYMSGLICDGIEDVLKALPSAQPEIMSDGTLHVTVDTDISTIGRVLVSQSGTQFGNMYYADGEEWIPVKERLPEEGNYYLTTVVYPYNGARYMKELYGDKDGFGIFADFHVIAWMPMEPWKGKET